MRWIRWHVQWKRGKKTYPRHVWFYRAQSYTRILHTIHIQPNIVFAAGIQKMWIYCWLFMQMHMRLLLLSLLYRVLYRYAQTFSIPSPPPLSRFQWELKASKRITTENIRPNISLHELHTHRANTTLLGANTWLYHRKIERFVIINCV